MRVRKAVIPAAGLGTRFLPATKAQPKEMLPVVDRPAIQYVVEEAVQAGITDLLIVLGRGKGNIEDHFDRAYELEAELERAGKHDMLKQVQAISELAEVHYVRQGDARGLGHAVLMGRAHVGDEPFAVLLPDDIFDPAARVLVEMITEHEQHGRSVLALRRVALEDIAAYGSARVEETPQGVRVTEVVEKPEPAEAPSDLAVLGRYVLTPDIFEAIERVEPGKGGEIQLTDAIGLVMQHQEVYGHVFTSRRWDIGSKLGFLQATVELALGRDDLGPTFRGFLEEVTRA